MRRLPKIAPETPARVAIAGRWWVGGELETRLDNFETRQDYPRQSAFIAHPTIQMLAY